MDFHKPFDRLPGHDVAAQGTVTGPDIPPTSSGELRISLPDGWRDHDALYLTAFDPECPDPSGLGRGNCTSGNGASLLSSGNPGDITVAERDGLY